MRHASLLTAAVLVAAAVVAGPPADVAVADTDPSHPSASDAADAADGAGDPSTRPTIRPPTAGWLLWQRGALEPQDAEHHAAGADASPWYGSTRAEVPRHRGAAAQPDVGTAREHRQEHHTGPVAPEGHRVAGGTSEAGDGPVVSYTVELDAGVEADISELVEIVEAALYDPRSWVDDHTLQRVDEPGTADIRVLLGAPGTVDALCAQAGLDTNGTFSCWNGRFAALNARRWAEGAAGFGDDVASYRDYLVNHEFGHGLGYGHVGCPAAGAPAPVMMQQTKGTDGCEPNGWPYPDAAESDG